MIKEMLLKSRMFQEKITSVDINARGGQLGN
jgi:hypothetical protein